MSWRGSLAVQVLELFAEISVTETQRHAHEAWGAHRVASLSPMRRAPRAAKPRQKKDPVVIKANTVARRRRYRAKNGAAINARRRARYAERRDVIAASRKAARWANIDLARAKERARAPRYRDRALPYLRAYYAANRERLKAAARARYRAKKSAALTGSEP